MGERSLPLIRHSERVDFKRCQKKWFWHWRMGLFPKVVHGALELGTWMHEALAIRYTTGITLAGAFEFTLARLIKPAEEESAMLGLAMAEAYDKRYGADESINIIAAEVPLEYPIVMDGQIVAEHKLKPDLVYSDANGDIWLMEHKTAKQIRLEHLPIDDQGRPYAAMAELALRRAKVITPRQHFKGVMYNFMRKALPDERPTDAQGRSLNKNGSVSAKQPAPIFIRHPIVLTRKAKQIALARLRNETVKITRLAEHIRNGTISPDWLDKTPHSSCPKLCPYFAMCVVEDQGGDIKTMQRTMYIKQNPYTYDEETADIPVSFELS